MTEIENAPYTTQYFPQNIALLTVGENMMPIGHWTVISKDPFRILLCLENSNHTLKLLRETGEATFNFMPWSERQKVARAGWISGRDYNKAEEIGFLLQDAELLLETKMVEGAEIVYEMVVHRELPDLSREFSIFVMDIIKTHGKIQPKSRQPILYLSLKDYATTGENWKYQK